MRYYYFDASVLVKAYLWEVGTADVRAVLAAMRATPPCVRVITSSLAFVEVASAVARRRFAGELTEEEANDVWRRLRHDFGAVVTFDVAEAGPALVNRAAELTRQHHLGADDAIHLATGLAARRSVPFGVDLHFASADQRLTAAALLEQFEVFDPRTPVPPETSKPVAPHS